MKRLLHLFLLLVLPICGISQTNTDGVITIGRNALYYEDYALSIQYFNLAIEAKPYLYEPYFYRAIAKYYLGDYGGSLDDCNAAVERDPFIDDIYKLRAINFIMTKQFNNAIKDYRKLLSMEIENRDIWSNMVLCETQMDSLHIADKMLDTMITKWPQYSRCYILKAQIAVQNADTLAASSLLDKTLEVSPHDVDAWSAKAQLLLQQNIFAKADSAYTKAILQKPKEAGFYLNRALCRYHLKNLRAAMDDYSIALDIDPDNYMGHYNRGLLRMQVGENNAAITDFDFVLQKNPDDRLALFNRATLSEETGNYRAAIKDYTTVLEQYPNFINGYANRARCYRAIGDIKHATSDERVMTIAQLDAIYGKTPKKKYTRKQKEQDIEDYKKIVVDNDEDNLAKFYESDYRGKIQNRDVTLELQPLFFFTFSKVNNGLSERYNYAAFVERINITKELHSPLYLSTREETTTNIDAIQKQDALLIEQLTKTPNNVQLLFYHALYQYAEHNYIDAITTLDKALKCDGNHEPSLFLRAIIKARQAELNTKPAPTATPAPAGINKLEEQNILIKAAIQDITQAILQDDTCPYLYYNRACLYAKLHDTEHAIADFNSAIQLNANLGEAYYNRGLLHIERKEMTNGYEDLSKAGEHGLYSAYSLIKHFRKQEK